MKRLIGFIFFLMASIVSEAQTEPFIIKKIIVGEQRKKDLDLEKYLFNYEMDGACVKQGAFSTKFLSDDNDTVLVAEGKYKNGYLYDTCKWFSIGAKTLYLEALFENDPSSATVFTIFYSGRMLCEKGCRTGEFKTYYLNTNQLNEKATYVNGKLTGTYEAYYENGKLASKTEYLENYKNGAFEEYDRQGMLTKKGYFDFKKSEIYYENYTDDGQFRTNVVKTKGDKIVYDTSFYRKNRICYRTYYTAGMIDSSFQYFSSGMLQKEEVYDAKGNGYRKWYYPNGNLKSSVEFKNRKSNGEELEYYLNGNKKSVHTNVNGMLNGPYVEWDENGKLIREAVYLNGKLNGPSNVYKEGRLTASGIFENGKLNGPSKEYDENGKLKSEKNYKNGILITEQKKENVKKPDIKPASTTNSSSTTNYYGKGETQTKAPKNYYDGNKDMSVTKREEDLDDVMSEESYNKYVKRKSVSKINHEILYNQSNTIDCSGLTTIKPVFNRDTFVNNLKTYLTTAEGKCLRKISKSIEMHIITGESKSVVSNQYNRSITKVTYNVTLKKNQEKVLTQFLLDEVLIYDVTLENIFYKLDYDLSIIPKELTK